MVGPRCFSWAEPRAILLILLVVVVLCLPDCEAARKKKPCKYNRKKYKPGEVIASVEDNCAEIRCSEKGKKIVLQPMKNCVCDKEGKQEEITNTTMDFMYNANINLNEKAAKKKKPCKYNRKNYMPGKVIEALEDNCVELKCSRKGKKTVLELIKNCVCGKEVPTGDGSISQIIDSSGTPYGPPDRVIDGEIRSHWNPSDLPRYHNNWYIVFELVERSVVDSMGLINFGDTTHDVTSFTLEGSEDKVNWYNGGAANNVQTGTREWQSFDNLNATGKYMKFTVTQTSVGWQPWLCEISFTECTPTCQNGGTCDESSVCQCPEGWSGDTCNKKECTPMCQNGGTCSASSVCQCQEGWSGDACVTEVLWRHDHRCGSGFPGSNGKAGQCNPNGVNPCCSGHGWCGASDDHCNCDSCVDYASVQRVEVYNVIYETDISTVLTHPGSSKVTTIINNSNTAQTTTTVITVTYQKTRKWEFSLALALGVTAEVKAGIPFFAEASYTFSAEITTTGTVGGTYTRTEEHQVRASIEVPANSRITAWVRYRKYRVDIPYTALLKNYYADGTTNIVQISGVYEGVDAAEFVVLYGETESIN